MASKVSGMIEQINALSGSNNVTHNIASTAYGYCETAAGTAAKVVDMTGFKLVEGVTIHVKFKEKNNASSPTLNVNGTGAKNIVQYDTTAVSITDETSGWYAGAVVSFTYDGTSWVRDQGFNTNSWRGIADNLTSSTATTTSLSAKQGYLLANGSARDSTKLPLAGGTMTGHLKFSGNDSRDLTWEDGTWWQRILTTDDSTADTAVFTFQQTSNSGSSWTDLFTIKDNGTVIATTFSGSGASLTSLNASNISSGTLNLARLGNQNANYVLAGPTSGNAAAPTFRTLVAADIPSLSWNKITSDKPAYTTRWPSWDEVTGKPSTFSPSTHTHSHLVALTTINSGQASPNNTHALAIKKYFDDNKSTVPRNALVNFYSSAYGNGSEAFGYYLSGYDSAPYGGFFIAHYDTPRYVGILGGSYTEAKLARIDTANTITTGQVMISDGTDGKIKSSGYTIAKSVPSNAVFTDHYAWGDITGKPTKITLTGAVTGNVSLGSGDLSLSTTVNHNHDDRYKIASGVITLGSNTITPVTSVNGHSGSSVTVTASDLGLASALKYVGSKSTLPTATDSTTYSTYNNGDVITVSNKEYAYVKGSNAAGSSWVELGDEGSYKLKQTAFTNSTGSADGTNTSTTFIYSFSQNANGVITDIKTRKLPTASTTAAGIIQIGTGATNAMAGNTTVTNVSYTSASDNNSYPILIKNTTGSTTTAAGVKFNTGVTINPSEGSITATEFIGNVKANKIIPTINKTYTDNNYYGTSDAEATCSKFFISVKPDSWYKPWRVRFKVRTYCPNHTNCDSVTYSTYSGRADSYIYANWNERYDHAHYYTVTRMLKKAGFDQGLGHAIGVNIRYSNGRGNSDYFRTIELDYFDCENCTVTVLDNAILWANWTNNSDTYYNGYSNANAVDRGLMESGDLTGDTSDRTLQTQRYLRFKSGAAGIGRYTLLMEESTGVYSSITTTFPTSNTPLASLTMNSGVKYKLNRIWYHNQGANRAANTNMAYDAQYWQQYDLIDGRYSFQYAAGALTAYKPFYMVGTIDSNGFFTIDPAATAWAQDLPTANTTKVYVYLGTVYPDTSPYRIALELHHPIYTFKDGALKEIHPGDITGNATNVTGTVAIANGGTGATTEADARTNLGLGSIATKASTDYVKYAGNITGVGSGSPASGAKTWWKNTTNVPKLSVVAAYNNSGTEYSMLFSKGNADARYGTILRWGYTDKYIRILRQNNANGDTWYSDDWEKISAGYADSATYATSAGSVAWANTGHPDTFPPTIGTTGTTAMAGNTNVNNVFQDAITYTDYTNWRPLIWGNSNSGTEGFTPADSTAGVFTTASLTCQPSTGTIRIMNLKLVGSASSAITYTDGTTSKEMIKFIKGDANGHAIKIGGGALTVVGGGESAQSITPSATAEHLYLLADNTIYIEANADTLANRIGFAVTTGGAIVPMKAESANNNKQDIGTSSNKWANVYATTFNGALSGNASTATKWASAQTVYVTLGTASTTTTLQGGSSSAQTIGVNGTLGVGNGGTGATDAATARTNLGAAASSHTHGNIQNGGTLQTNDITIANGDKIIVTDSSDSSKIARTSISFDASTTTKALSQKGTWETFNNVTQTAKSDNVNYKVLTTTSASPTSGSAAGAAYTANVYINASASSISAVQHRLNVGGTDKALIQYNNTDSSIDFIFI